MPVRKRNVKRRGKLDADEEAWLRGERNCGFVEFMPWETLEALWEAFGDHEAFECRRGMDRPAPRGRILEHAWFRSCSGKGVSS